MNLLEHINLLLIEMIVHGQKRESGTTVIAFRKDIWLFDADDEIPLRTWNAIKQATGMPPRTETPYGAEAYEVADVFEDRPDVLVGETVRNSLTIYSRSAFRLNPQSSLLAKKVVDELGLRGIFHQSLNPSDEGEEDYTARDDIRGRIPDVMYHGTSAKYLMGILRKGLRPSQAPSNWAKQGVSHSDLIFMDQDITNAMSHAGMTGQKTSSPAVVLELEVPDKAKLFPDYDIDVASGFTTYDQMAAAHTQRKMKTTKMLGKSSTVTKELGVWAYKGAILPMKIRSVYISTAEESDFGPSRRDFVEMDRKRAKLWAQLYMDLGDEAIYYTDEDSIKSREAISKLGDLSMYLNDTFDEDSVTLDGNELTIVYGEFTSGEEISLSTEAKKTVLDRCEFQDAMFLDEGEHVEFQKCEFDDCTFDLQDKPDLPEDADDSDIEAFIRGSEFFSRFSQCVLRDCLLETEDGDELEFSISL